MTPHIILGPPGCGKTTDNLATVQKLLSAGARANRIAFLAFTRKAAEEARERALEIPGTNAEDLLYYRTIHSMAFKLGGLSPKNLLRHADLQAVADSVGLSMKEETTDLDEDLAAVIGISAEPIFFLDNFARAAGRSLEDIWEERMEANARYDFDLGDLLAASDALRRRKAATGLCDFTDALDEYVRHGAVPELDALIVDEAQDLSTLQWRCVERLATKAKAVYIAGDDDQAIFKWAGADVEYFRGLQGHEKVLGHSYRLPRAVKRLADRQLEKIAHRRVKPFEPRDEEGSVEWLGSEDEIQGAPDGPFRCSKDEARLEWLFLARHGYQIRGYEELCRREGWLYSSRGRTSNASPAARALIAWENIRRGRMAPAVDLKEAAGMITGFRILEDRWTAPEGSYVGRDYPGLAGAPLHHPWHVALEGMSAEESDYFRQARRAGEQLAKPDSAGQLQPAEPRIKISTIHGSKGGEAKNVALMTDISRATLDSIERDEAEEARVFYVGLTRAKQNLFLLEPSSPFNYEIG